MNWTNCMTSMTFIILIISLASLNSSLFSTPSILSVCSTHQFHQFSHSPRSSQLPRFPQISQIYHFHQSSQILLHISSYMSMPIQQAKCPPIAMSYVPAARFRALYIIRHLLLSQLWALPAYWGPSPLTCMTIFLAI